MNGWDGVNYPVAVACDSSAAGFYSHSRNHYGVTGSDYIDFIFTFDDANTWCSGYRQSTYNGHATFSTKDIQISTSNDKIHWTRVTDSTIKDPYGNTITDTHSTWNNVAATNTFPNDGTTTEWTPEAPIKYLRVRTLTKHGLRDSGGVLTVKYLQLKFAVGAY